MLWIVGPVAADYYEYFNLHKLPYGQFLHTGTRQLANQAVYLDFDHPMGFKDILASLRPKPNVTAVMVTGMEAYVTPAVHIADYFGVAALPLAAAQNATDKILMRQRFMEYDPRITPPFRAVESWQDVESFFVSQSGSVMLKPANLMKSLFVTKNDTLPELRKNYQYLQTHLAEAYRRNHLAKPRILVESYMAGSMHTVAGFVDAAGKAELAEGIADCLMASDIGKHDNYLYARSLPSRLSGTEKAALRAVTRAGSAALGLRSTAIHAELILTAEGPKIIEIAARIGGFRPRMYQQAYGLDLYHAALQTAAGQSATLTSTKQSGCAVIELFPESSGKFVSIKGAVALKRLPTFVGLKVRPHKHQPVGRASQGYRAAAIINLAGAPAQIEADTRFIQNNVAIRIQA